MSLRRVAVRFGLAALSGAVLAAALPPAAAAAAERAPPDFIDGPVFVRHYDADNDLLTAGLGWDGIAGPAPAVSNPPTAPELRRLSIYNSMRGLLSTSPTEGYGSVYAKHGPVPGTEYLAFVRGSDGSASATLLVQVPDRLDTDRPCLVTAPSSGSRGIYGAISNAEVAFEHGCAVAYTDKGTGIGFHDLTPDVVYNLVGKAKPSGDTQRAHFRVEETRALNQFKRRFPHRIAVKHAHSGENPERLWGSFVLQSIRFGIWAMNNHPDRPDRPWTHEDIRIVAAGVSNGGGAALLAAEQDRAGLIDGIVVSEPQVQPRRGRFTILDRGEPVRSHSRSLYDVTTFMDVYADCAGVDTNAVTPAPPGVARCAELSERGLLNAVTLIGQVQEARNRIHRFGLLPDADGLLPSHASLHLWRILAPVYGNSYARARIADHLCKTSFASTDGDGDPVAWDAANRGKAFSAANGLPAGALVNPTNGPFIVNDAADPPKNELTSPDLNLDGALCWRALATGRAEPTPVLPPEAAHRAARRGIAEVRASGDLQGKPAIILHGRKDALVAPNHSSRAYFGLNQLVEGRNSRARYIEIVYGNHFDAFIPLYPALGAPGETLVAAHGYFNQAVDLMLRHLDDNGETQLPGSQAFAATEETCPFPTDPPRADRIRFRDSDHTLIIPEGEPPECAVDLPTASE